MVPIADRQALRLYYRVVNRDLPKSSVPRLGAGLKAGLSDWSQYISSKAKLLPAAARPATIPFVEERQSSLFEETRVKIVKSLLDQLTDEVIRAECDPSVIGRNLLAIIDDLSGT